MDTHSRLQVLDGPAERHLVHIGACNFIIQLTVVAVEMGGLSIEEAKNFLSIAHPYVDIVKLGFGTSFVTPQLREKIKAYQSYDLPVYFGGTLFEAFLIRNQFQDYVDTLKEYNISYMEVSDGSITIPHAEKCGYIEKLTKYGVVFSEVGSKDAEHIIPPYKWIELMKNELNAQK